MIVKAFNRTKEDCMKLKQSIRNYTHLTHLLFMLHTVQVALSADFYGASYAVFPAFTATAHFDISLSFRTYFGDGLMLFVGSAAQVCSSHEL